MSIPTRLHVMLKDGEILYNKCLFTISYGADLRDRNVWLERFKYAFENPRRKDFIPWFDDFVLIQTEPYFHVFTRHDLGLPNVYLADAISSTS